MLGASDIKRWGCSGTSTRRPVWSSTHRAGRGTPDSPANIGTKKIDWRKYRCAILLRQESGPRKLTTWDGLRNMSWSLTETGQTKTPHTLKRAGRVPPTPSREECAAGPNPVDQEPASIARAGFLTHGDASGLASPSRRGSSSECRAQWLHPRISRWVDSQGPPFTVAGPWPILTAFPFVSRSDRDAPGLLVSRR